MAIVNSLKEKCGLGDPLGPVEWFWRSPDELSLRSVPKRLQTPEMLDAVVAQYDGSFNLMKHASGRALTDEHRMKIVSVKGSELHYVSERHITPELAWAAVENAPRALVYVPERMRTKALCEMAVSKGGRALEFVPDALKTEELCGVAVSQDGRGLKFVPTSMRTYGLCLAAVENDRDSDWYDEHRALEYVPDGIINGPRGKEICEAAVNANGLALKTVPTEYKSAELVRSAIGHDPCIWSRSAIQYVPASLMSRQLVELSLKVSPGSIRNFPPCARRYVTDEMCVGLLRDNPNRISDIPDSFLSRKKIADFAIEQSPRALCCLPDKSKTKARCFFAKERDPEGVRLDWFPEKVREKWERARPVNSGLRNLTELFSQPHAPERLSLPGSLEDGALAIRDNGHLMAHQLEDAPSKPTTLCYVSDIHLEHQVDLAGCKTQEEAEELIRSKVRELVSSIVDSPSYILLAGDVADSVEVAELFYEILVDELDEKQLRTTIVSVLGNHELWDGDSHNDDGNGLEGAVATYRKALDAACERSVSVRGLTLENNLLVLYKGRRPCIISEEDIIRSDEGELAELCSESSLLLLGGLGYSGLNPEFNAGMGLYRDAVTPDQDVALSERFRAVHDKLARCAGRRQAIVLTHTPIQNWLPSAPNDDWVYINGHTHHNGMIVKKDGPTILFDNQIGYEPRKWHFNSLVLEGKYDPFALWEDGIHKITPTQYRDFNRDRGIYSEFNREGTPYVAKREGLYMFFLENNGELYRLEGGRIRTTEHTIAWYYDNMPQYAARVRGAFKPYREALQRISEEVRSFGGYGFVHGCIVDIDLFNHIYLNPVDGTVTPYYALDTESREVFDTVEALLASSPELSFMLQGYVEQNLSGNLTLLSDERIRASHNNAIAVPEQMLDRSIYEPSRIMRSVQYLLDNDVIRIWRDSVLEAGLGSEKHADMNALNSPGSIDDSRSLPEA